MIAKGGVAIYPWVEPGGKLFMRSGGGLRKISAMDLLAMSLKTERRWPYAVATLVALAVAGFGFVFSVGSLPEGLAIGTMTVGVVVAGFTATQRNMLLGMSGSKVLQIAARSGYNQDIMLYLGESLFVAVAVASISALRFVVGEHLPWGLVWTLWAWFISLLFTLIIRNELLMFNIFSRFMEEQGTQHRST